MSEHPNITIMRAALEAFASGDAALLAQVFAPDIVWTVPGTSALAGRHVGHDAVFGFFGALSDLSGGSFALYPEWMMADDDGLVLFHGTTAQRGDRVLDVDTLVHVRMRGGQIIAGTDYFHDEHRWDAFWA